MSQEFDQGFKNAIKNVADSKTLDTLQQLVEFMKKKYDSQSAIGETEFETLRLTISKESKKQALDELINTLLELGSK